MGNRLLGVCVGGGSAPASMFGKTPSNSWGGIKEVSKEMGIFFHSYVLSLVMNGWKVFPVFWLHLLK